MTVKNTSSKGGVDSPSRVEKMAYAVLDTKSDMTALLVRVILGVVIFPHGAQKLLGWFGGSGFERSMSYITDVVGMPTPVAFLAIMAESLGALALILGLFSRVVAIGIGLVLLGATLAVHLPVGFFMDWSGKLAGEGFEYHLLGLGLVLVIVTKGGGALSLDNLLVRRLSPNVRA